MISTKAEYAKARAWSRISRETRSRINSSNMRQLVVRDLSPETEQGLRVLAFEQGTGRKVRNRDDESFELDAGLNPRFKGIKSGL